MSIETNKTLISKIVPRPPARQVTERFWTWLQEQIEKIVTALNGRHTIAYLDFTAHGNPAGAGQQLIVEHEIDAGVFDGIMPDFMQVQFFGSLANNGNTKTIELSLNNNAIFTIATTEANKDWLLTLYIGLVDVDNQKTLTQFTIDGEVSSIIRDQLTAMINVSTDNLTISLDGESSGPAANDILVEMFKISVERTPRI